MSKPLTCLIDCTKLNVLFGKVVSPTTVKKCKNGTKMKQWQLEIELGGMTKRISCKAFDLLPKFRKGSKMFFKGEWDFWNGYSFFIVNDVNLTGDFEECEESDELPWDCDATEEDTY